MSGAPVTGNGLNGGLEFERPIVRIERQIEALEVTQEQTGRDYAAEIRELRTSLVAVLKKTYSGLSAWETVQVARHKDRTLARDYIEMLVQEFCELRGDRRYGNDQAIVCGFGRIAGTKVMIVAEHKGRDTKEKLSCNFGCPHPEGYRKALAKMKLAEKFGLPIVTLIDTQGAYPGVGAEERGIAEAIACNLMEMSRLRAPIVSVVIGEGGSGGALGIGVGDRLAILEHGFYSVISPEGCAAILWRSADHAPQAAEALQMTAGHLADLGVVDDVIPEPLGGAHRDPQTAGKNVEKWLSRTLRDLRRTKLDNLVARRYKRLRELGSKYIVNGSK